MHIWHFLFPLHHMPPSGSRAHTEWRSTYAQTCGPRIKLLFIWQNNELNRTLNGYLNASGWTQRLPAGEKVGEKEAVAEGEERMEDWEDKNQIKRQGSKWRLRGEADKVEEFKGGEGGDNHCI